MGPGRNENGFIDLEVGLWGDFFLTFLFICAQFRSLNINWASIDVHHCSRLQEYKKKEEDAEKKKEEDEEKMVEEEKL